MKIYPNSRFQSKYLSRFLHRIHALRPIDLTIVCRQLHSYSSIYLLIRAGPLPNQSKKIYAESNYRSIRSPPGAAVLDWKSRPQKETFRTKKYFLKRQQETLRESIIVEREKQYSQLCNRLARPTNQSQINTLIQHPLDMHVFIRLAGQRTHVSKFILHYPRTYQTPTYSIIQK